MPMWLYINFRQPQIASEAATEIDVKSHIFHEGNFLLTSRNKAFVKKTEDLDN